MRKTMYLAIVMLLASSVALASDAMNGHAKGKKDASDERVEGAGTTVAVHVAFLPREVRIIREYYAPRYRNLPPGLEKKYRRTGQLPPGWQKKMEPFPVALERQLQVLPAGYQRGVIDGHAVIYNHRTQVIADIAVLF
jgi:hypothetical protein